MPYVDYNFYITNYGGAEMPPLKFNGIANRASMYIDTITFKRINPNEVCEEVKMATCAVIDVICKFEEVGIKTSEKIGDYSVQYKNSTTSKEKEMYKEAKVYLANTGLMYRGN